MGSHNTSARNRQFGRIDLYSAFLQLAACRIYNVFRGHECSGLHHLAQIMGQLAACQLEVFQI
jgi:hypothetical protein